MASICFHIGKNPVCYWDDAPNETSVRALDFLDPEFFLEAASSFRSNGEILDFSDRRLDFLVVQYWISMEALLSLIAALVQAPSYFYGWIIAAKGSDIDYVIDAISNEKSLPSSRVENHSWKSVAQWIFRDVDSEESQLAENFAKLWTTIVAEYSMHDRREAYNRIKHGFVAKKNALKSVSINERTFPVVGGKFGHHFWHAERIDENKQNFSILERIVHWEPEHCIQAVEFVGVSIYNIKQILKARLVGSSGEIGLYVPSSDVVASFIKSEVATQKPISMRLQSVTYPSPLPTKDEIEKQISKPCSDG